MIKCAYRIGISSAGRSHRTNHWYFSYKNFVLKYFLHFLLKCWVWLFRSNPKESDWRALEGGLLEIIYVTLFWVSSHKWDATSELLCYNFWFLKKRSRRSIQIPVDLKKVPENTLSFGLIKPRESCKGSYHSKKRPHKLELFPGSYLYTLFLFFS